MGVGKNLILKKGKQYILPNNFNALGKNIYWEILGKKIKIL